MFTRCFASALCLVMLTVRVSIAQQPNVTGEFRYPNLVDLAQYFDLPADRLSTWQLLRAAKKERTSAYNDLLTTEKIDKQILQSDEAFSNFVLQRASEKQLIALGHFVFKWTWETKALDKNFKKIKRPTIYWDRRTPGDLISLSLEHPWWWTGESSKFSDRVDAILKTPIRAYRFRRELLQRDLTTLMKLDDENPGLKRMEAISCFKAVRYGKLLRIIHSYRTTHTKNTFDETLEYVGVRSKDINTQRKLRRLSKEKPEVYERLLAEMLLWAIRRVGAYETHYIPAYYEINTLRDFLFHAAHHPRFDLLGSRRLHEPTFVRYPKPQIVLSWETLRKRGTLDEDTNYRLKSYSWVSLLGQWYFLGEFEGEFRVRSSYFEDPILYKAAPIVSGRLAVRKHQTQNGIGFLPKGFYGNVVSAYSNIGGRTNGTFDNLRIKNIEDFVYPGARISVAQGSPHSIPGKGKKRYVEAPPSGVKFFRVSQVVDGALPGVFPQALGTLYRLKDEKAFIENSHWGFHRIPPHLSSIDLDKWDNALLSLNKSRHNDWDLSTFIPHEGILLWEDYLLKSNSRVEHLKSGRSYRLGNRRAPFFKVFSFTEKNREPYALGKPLGAHDLPEGTFEIRLKDIKRRRKSMVDQ